MFADNDQISGKQLFCQMTLGLLGAMIVCLPGREISGIRGSIASILAAGVLLFHIFWLIRLTPAYTHLERYAGTVGEKAIGLLFFCYYSMTGAFLTAVIDNLVSEYMVLETSPVLVYLVVILTCITAGVPQIQRRGRMAEFCFPFLITVTVLMMILAYVQNRGDFSGYLLQKTEMDVDTFLQDIEILLLVCTCINGVPFLLGNVKGKRFVALSGGMVLVLGFVIAALLLLQGSYGSVQTGERQWPLLSLMAGIRLGDGTAVRLDPVWVGFLLFYLLFSVGSAFFYGNYIVKKTHLGVPWYGMYLLVFLLSIWKNGTYEITNIYIECVRYFFAPLMFVWNLYLIWSVRRQRI